METLYRKYRPLDFDTVVGQDVIVKTLRNQILKGSIAHAYLFCGTRGTGKTTIAKIFARAINCPNENNGNPCNECNACKSALDGANYNILEMDAASNRGVEDIRKITEAISYPPINDQKYKVFIIDEAHALTDTAVQAFLKSLEEPPEYVVFILATTDPNKLPETILSRCQKYNFKRISVDEIVEYLKKICVEEKIDIDDDALVFIAEKSDGSMRESISKLDRCRAYAPNDKFDKEKVINLLGVVGDDEYRNLTKYVNEGNIHESFKIISECIDKGKDINQFANDFIWHLRNLLIVKDLKEPVETLNITRSNFDKLKKESEAISKDVLIYFIEELSKTTNIMKYDENRRVLLETAIIRLATPESNFLESAVMARLKKMEEAQSSGTYVKIDSKVDNTEKKEEKKEEPNKKITSMKLKEATFEEIKKVSESWQTIISSLDRYEKIWIEKSKPYPTSESGTGFIEVVTNDEMEYEILKKDNKLKKVEEDLKEATLKIIGKEIVYKIINKKDAEYDVEVAYELDAASDKIAMPIEDDD